MKYFTGGWFIFLLVIAGSSTYAQKQNNQWRFGSGGAIDFNTVPPSFVPGCPIATYEGSASVADRTTGALLFYTDGVTVWNANNQVMPNGTGDAVAALFTAHWLATDDVATALSRAASSIFAVLEKTREMGERELQLVAAQDFLLSPPWRFVAEKL